MKMIVFLMMQLEIHIVLMITIVIIKGAPTEAHDLPLDEDGHFLSTGDGPVDLGAASYGLEKKWLRKQGKTT